MAGPVSSVMDAAERTQGMLDKHLATGVIVLLALVVLWLVRALGKQTDARVDDQKEVNQGLLTYIAENTKATIALTRAVEAKLVRKPRNGGAADPPAAIAPGPTPPTGDK